MSKWLQRGIVFAVGMVILRVLQGLLINVFDRWALIISIALVVLYTIAVFVRGIVDGRSDARAHPDPDRRGDLAMTWLLAGLFAGVVSGAVSSIIALFWDGLYAQSIIPEVTTLAAFVALLVFVVAIAGAALGRFLVDRKAPPVQRRGADDDRADTDVFEAVRDDDASDDAADDAATDDDASDEEATAKHDAARGADGEKERDDDTVQAGGKNS